MRAHGEAERRAAALEGGAQVERVFHERDAVAPAPGHERGEREGGRVSHDDEAVAGGGTEAVEIVEDGLRRIERERVFARREGDLLDEEARIGERAADTLDLVSGSARDAREDGEARLAERRLEFLARAVREARAHAHVHRTAGHGDPLADQDVVGRCSRCCFGLRGERPARGRRCRRDGRRRRFGRRGRLGHLGLGRHGVELFRHSSPLSQRSWPDAAATSVKLLLRMSMVMSAVCS